MVIIPKGISGTKAKDCFLLMTKSVQFFDASEEFRSGNNAEVSDQNDFYTLVKEVTEAYTDYLGNIPIEKASEAAKILSEAFGADHLHAAAIGNKTHKTISQMRTRNPEVDDVDCGDPTERPALSRGNSWASDIKQALEQSTQSLSSHASSDTGRTARHEK